MIMAAAMMMHSCKTQYSVCVLMQFSYNKVSLIRFDGDRVVSGGVSVSDCRRWTRLVGEGGTDFNAKYARGHMHLRPLHAYGP